MLADVVTTSVPDVMPRGRARMTRRRRSRQIDAAEGRQRILWVGMRADAEALIERRRARLLDRLLRDHRTRDHC